MTLSPKQCIVEIITLWHFRLPLLIQIFIKVATSPRLLGIGMPSTGFKIEETVKLISHPAYEGTQTLRTAS